MPNYVKCVLKIHNIETPEEYMRAIACLTKNVVDEKTHIISEQIIDFNTIIPEPKTKSKCPEEYILKDDPVAPIEGKPWFNWYDWRIANWGTKWEACEPYTRYGSSSILFIFETAWAAPIPILKRIADMGFEFIIQYADEDQGMNCGEIQVTQLDDDGNYYWNETLGEDMDDSEQFAEEVWDGYYSIL